VEGLGSVMMHGGFPSCKIRVGSPEPCEQIYQTMFIMFIDTVALQCVYCV